MPLVAIQPQAGTVKDASEYSVSSYVDSEKIRFRSVQGAGAQPQTIGGWELKCTDTVLGKVRGAHQWRDNQSNSYLAIGSHRKLMVERGDNVWDITPCEAPASLPNNPVSVTNNQTSTTITTTGSHYLTVGTFVYITGLAATGGVTVGGGSGSFASNPFATTLGSTIVQVTLSAHGLKRGDFVTISGVSGAQNGIPDSELNTQHSVYVTSSSQFFIEITTPATSSGATGGTPAYVTYKQAEVVTVPSATTFTITTAQGSSTATGGGNSGSIIIELQAGLESSTAQAGYGTGSFGMGVYGSGGEVATTYDARIWCLENYGEDLVAVPRGGSLYRWQLNRSQRAAVNAATDCPTKINFMTVTPEQYLMLGGCDDGTGFDGLLVIWAAQAQGFTTGDWTAKATNTSRSLRLGAGSHIQSMIPSSFVTVVMTDSSMHQLRFLKDTVFIYSQDLVANVGIMGPNAWAKDSQTGGLMFLSANWQFYTFLNGQLQAVPCPVRDFIRDAVVTGTQQSKIVGTGISQYGEGWFFYPASNLEVNKYVIYSFQTQTWATGTFNRTYALDGATFIYPIMFDYTDGSENAQIWLHEKGNSAQGDAFESWIEASPVDLNVEGEGEVTMDVSGIVPDFQSLSAGGELYLLTKDKPNSTEIVNGPFAIGPTTERVDVRVTGRQLGWKFVRNGAPNTWRLGKMRFDINASGGRRD